MANAVYPKFKEAALSGGIDLTTDDVRIALVRTSAYTYSAAHEFMSSVSEVARTDSLTGKSVTDGVFDATGGGTATSVPAGAAIDAIIYYIHTGTPATERLIAYKDTGFTPATITPDGNNIEIQNGGSGFTL